MSGSDARATNAFWGRDGLERKILDALAAGHQNREERRIIMTQAVLERRAARA
jgi:hypothetical protein